MFGNVAALKLVMPTHFLEITNRLLVRSIVGKAITKPQQAGRRLVAFRRCDGLV